MAGDLEDLKWGLEQVRGGEICPNLNKTLPLSQGAVVNHLISTNQVTGNLVLVPWAA